MQNIQLRPPIYDPEAVQPMRDELLFVGFEELTTPQLVEDVLSVNDEKTVFLFINSVCGCSAGSARPGASLALQHSKIPDRLVTVFAGQDRDAVDHLRNKYLTDVPPSSPFMALFKNGKALEVLPRHHIEGRSPEDIASFLTAVFEEHCSRTGPSIPASEYEKLVYARMCGSKIPFNN
jgi:putative YphP/YqiW family bacilliredoxin